VVYHWLTIPELPDEVAEEVGLLMHFGEQGEAEAWLTGAYEELAAAGVHEVCLYESDRLVYGPMSLDA
jgi:hypothetical protein